MLVAQEFDHVICVIFTEVDPAYLRDFNPQCPQVVVRQALPIYKIFIGKQVV